MLIYNNALHPLNSVEPSWWQVCQKLSHHTLFHLTNCETIFCVGHVREDIYPLTLKYPEGIRSGLFLSGSRFSMLLSNTTFNLSLYPIKCLEHFPPVAPNELILIQHRLTWRFSTDVNPGLSVTLLYILLNY